MFPGSNPKDHIFTITTVNDFGIWNLQAIQASTYENFTGPKVY
jgi:hypothetical protein